MAVEGPRRYQVEESYCCGDGSDVAEEAAEEEGEVEGEEQGEEQPVPQPVRGDGEDAVQLLRGTKVQNWALGGRGIFRQRAHVQRDQREPVWRRGPHAHAPPAPPLLLFRPFLRTVAVCLGLAPLGVLGYDASRDEARAGCARHVQRPPAPHR